MLRKIFSRDDQDDARIIQRAKRVAHRANIEQFFYKLLFCLAAQVFFLLGALLNYSQTSFSSLMLEAIVFQAAIVATFIWQNLHYAMHVNVIKAMIVSIVVFPALLMTHTLRDSLMQTFFVLMCMYGLYATYQRRGLFSHKPPVLVITDSKINAFILTHLQNEYRIALMVDFSRTNNIHSISTVHSQESAHYILSRRNVISYGIFPRKIVCVCNNYNERVMNCAFTFAHQFSLPVYRTIDAYEQASYNENHSSVIHPISIHNVDAPYHMDPQTHFMLSALLKDYEVWFDCGYNSVFASLIEIISAMPIKKLIVCAGGDMDLVNMEHKLTNLTNVSVCMSSCADLLKKGRKPDVLFYKIPMEIESALAFDAHNVDSLFYNNILHTLEIFQRIQGIAHTFLFSSQYSSDSLVSISHRICELIAQNYSYTSYKTHSRVVPMRLPVHLSHPNGRLFRNTHDVYHGKKSHHVLYRTCHTNDIVRIVVDVISAELRSHVEPGDCLVISPPFKTYNTQHLVSALTGAPITPMLEDGVAQQVRNSNILANEELCSSSIAGALLSRLHIAAMHPFDVLYKWDFLSSEEKIGILRDLISFFIRN